MPIYEYECLTCSVRFERKQSVNDEPVKICPDCGGKVRKVFYPAGIIFKGSGFYKTDYASSSSSSSSSDSPATRKTEPAKSEAAKSETKAEPAKSATAKSDAKASEK